jgi:hypothetical protein
MIAEAIANAAMAKMAIAGGTRFARRILLPLIVVSPAGKNLLPVIPPTALWKRHPPRIGLHNPSKPHGSYRWRRYGKSRRPVRQCRRCAAGAPALPS